MESLSFSMGGEVVGFGGNYFGCFEWDSVHGCWEYCGGWVCSWYDVVGSVCGYYWGSVCENWSNYSVVSVASMSFSMCGEMVRLGCNYFRGFEWYTVDGCWEYVGCWVCSWLGSICDYWGGMSVSSDYWGGMSVGSDYWTGMSDCVISVADMSFNFVGQMSGGCVLDSWGVNWYTVGSNYWKVLGTVGNWFDKESG